MNNTILGDIHLINAMQGSRQIAKCNRARAFHGLRASKPSKKKFSPQYIQDQEELINLRAKDKRNTDTIAFTFRKVKETEA
jgi:hypothetical protein